MYSPREQIQRKCGSLPFAKRTIYDRAILPILWYEIEVWDSPHQSSPKQKNASLRARDARLENHSVPTEAAQTIAGYSSLHRLLEEESRP